MKYETHDVSEEIDILILSAEEFEHFNSIYKDGIGRRYPASTKSGDIADMNKIIVTDGFHRMEFHIQIAK